MAIAGGGEIAELAGALGERGQHGVTVGDGFVSGQFEAAGERVDGLDDFGFHDEGQFSMGKSGGSGGWFSDEKRSVGRRFYRDVVARSMGARIPPLRRQARRATARRKKLGRSGRDDRVVMSEGSAAVRGDSVGWELLEEREETNSVGGPYYQRERERKKNGISV